jgi:hypothetical protein
VTNASTGRRVLLDENIDVRLATSITGHSVSTVRTEGWVGVWNGELLRRAEEAGFEVFVTADRNLQYQQALSKRAFGTVVLFPRRLKLEFLLALLPDLAEAVAVVGPGQVLHVHPQA